MHCGDSCPNLLKKHKSKCSGASGKCCIQLEPCGCPSLAEPSTRGIMELSQVLGVHDVSKQGWKPEAVLSSTDKAGLAAKQRHSAGCRLAGWARKQ
eukprot:503149-Pelagomonas_calceolata.AAC.1